MKIHGKFPRVDNFLKVVNSQIPKKSLMYSTKSTQFKRPYPTPIINY